MRRCRAGIDNGYGGVLRFCGLTAFLEPTTCTVTCSLQAFNVGSFRLAVILEMHLRHNLAVTVGHCDVSRGIQVIMGLSSGASIAQREEMLPLLHEYCI